MIRIHKPLWESFEVAQHFVFDPDGSFVLFGLQVLRLQGAWGVYMNEWNGMEWNGMEWNGMEWNGMEWKND